MKKKTHYHEVETAGLIDDYQMMFNPGPSKCGSIKNGVALCDEYGWWVIPFSELQEMYDKAREVRGLPPRKEGNTTTR